MTTRTALTCGCARKDATARRNSGVPASSRYCLGVPVPKRLPRPAATTRATQVDIGRFASSGLTSTPISASYGDRDILPRAARGEDAGVGSEAAETHAEAAGHPDMWLSLIALTTIFPAVFQAFRGTASRDAVFWGTLAVGIAGPLAWVSVHSAPAWQTGLAATLWVTIATTLALYAVVAGVFRQAWRLSPLLAGYMLLLGLGAVIWHNAGGEPLQAAAGDRAWVNVHISTGVVTYGLVTIAAVAAFAAF